ncbi:MULTISPECIES: response regulator [unclassified Arcicella]|uniref:response regulator n=1 Tax=unclassified Arcicella TaxID=2644986 RepID=UPI002856C853|nr:MULTISPECIES: response regulator [unclassified Arcicella]MDR6561780.1 CheY-like chemotaxis protein [Arcicella sp. BE51]MDR6812560.1 CheY-like chemotaxis protein [Arcicella sp. BE140]MDR6823668.1 CheY-like chemotaxis protein [Arcicella sp. BE139]
MMKTVFLIDDDLDEREIFQESLHALNLEVNYVEAKNGAEALEKLDLPNFKKPDIIFLDLNMPIMDGRKFLKEVKGHDKYNNIPVIIYSTSSNEIDRQFAIENQASMFMTKPYSLEVLRAEIKHVIKSFLQV